MAEELVLPMTPIISTTKSPKKMILFSKPKTGKTTILSKLPKCLIMDFEEGTDYVDAVKVKIIGIKPPSDETDDEVSKRRKQNKHYLVEIARAIKLAGNPYNIIGVDTISAVENMCVGYAEELYANSPMGKNWFTSTEGGKSKYGNILNLPDGAGYKWLRDAFEKVTEVIDALAPHIIYAGHVKDIILDKNGTDFTSQDLDLTGKLKRIAMSDADAIAYMTRKGKTTILNFKSGTDISCGTRVTRLEGKELVISEKDEKGDIITHWDEIYID